jgi:hypothetical protein
MPVGLVTFKADKNRIFGSLAGIVADIGYFRVGKSKGNTGVM